MTEAAAEPVMEVAIATDPVTEPEQTVESEPNDTDQSTATAEGDNAEGTEAPEVDEGRMLKADYTRKTQALSEREKALATREQRWDTAIQQSETLLSVLGQEFESEFSAVNWDELVQSDPAAWAAKWQKRTTRLAKLQQIAKHLQQQKTQRAAEAIEAERKALLDALPEWKNEAKATSEMGEIRTYMAKAGYSPEQINNVTDHREVLLARKAMLYDKLMAKAPKPAPVTAAPVPIPKAQTKATAAPTLGDPNLTDAQFAAIRKRQIAQRRP